MPVDGADVGAASFDFESSMLRVLVVGDARPGGQRNGCEIWDLSGEPQPTERLQDRGGDPASRAAEQPMKRTPLHCEHVGRHWVQLADKEESGEHEDPVRQDSVQHAQTKLAPEAGP